MECFKKYKLLRVKINIVKVMVLISDLVRIAAAGGGFVLIVMVRWYLI